MRPSSLEFAAGLLLVGRVRDILEGMKLIHPELHWHEGRGWVQRKFTVVGTDEAVKEVLKRLQILKKGST